MATRRNISINLNDEDHLALRHALLTEGISLGDFFGRCAREYVAAKQGAAPTAKAATVTSEIRAEKRARRSRARG